MDDLELKTLLTRKIDRALNNDDGDVSDVRQKAFEQYYGMAYGDEEEGRSQFVTRETFEAVEWALPSVLRVFSGNDRAVEFEPLHESDEQQAEQETDIVNHYIARKNNGFLVTYEWVKDILMYPNGYVGCWVEEKTAVKHEFWSGLTMQGLQAAEADPEIEIVEATGRIDTVDTEQGPMEIELWDIKTRREFEKKELRIECISPDELLVDDGHASIDLDRATFVCHRRRRTASDLAEMGYDPADLDALGNFDDQTWNDERTTRLFYEEESPDSEEDETGASRVFWVHDIYAKIDVDDDGIAELRHIVMIGGEIFENEEVGYQPFVAASAIIMQHKHIGMGYIEAVEDLQLVKTVLTRQLLDNVYAHNDKRHFINEMALLPDNSTMDDYLDARSTAIIVRGSPHEHIMPEQSSPILSELIAVLDHFGEQAQVRTGVAPTLSLDPSVLKDATMGAFMGALDQASQRLELLVRVLAETGFKALYRKVHYLMRQFVNEPINVKIRGNWVNVNPSEWVERDDIAVNVGLGHSNKQIKLGLLEQLFSKQQMLMGSGIVDQQKIYNTLRKMVETADMGSPNSFWIDPAGPEFQPPQPPEPTAQEQAILMQAQSFMQREQTNSQKVQAEAMAAMQKMQAEMVRQAEELRITRERLDLERARTFAEIDREERASQVSGAKAVADVRNTHADTEQKRASTVKTYADAGKTQADADRLGLETSEEYRAAAAVIDALTGEYDEPSEETEPAD